MLSVVSPDLGSSVRDVTVMSRNLYLGFDLMPLLQAFETGNPATIIGATSEAWQDLLATNFPERAEAIAEEIEDASPALVGLQEVTLYRTGEFNDLAPAEEVAFDHLQILLDAMEARGLNYAPVAVTTNDDFEAPAWTTYGPKDIRLTDRDVILARTDLPTSQMKLSNVQEANFVHSAPHPFIPFLDGWNSVDVKLRGKEFRFVNAHLDPFSPEVRVAQAAELLGGPANTNMSVIMVGDFNSPADIPGAPAYEFLVDAGFHDAWSLTHPSEAGYTWGHAPDLQNDEPLSQANERIDLALFRGDVTALSMDRVGEELSDRTSPSLLWPSDHVGVVATLGIQVRPEERDALALPSRVPAVTEFDSIGLQGSARNLSAANVDRVFDSQEDSVTKSSALVIDVARLAMSTEFLLTDHSTDEDRPCVLVIPLIRELVSSMAE